MYQIVDPDLNPYKPVGNLVTASSSFDPTPTPEICIDLWPIQRALYASKPPSHAVLASFHIRSGPIFRPCGILTLIKGR